MMLYLGLIFMPSILYVAWAIWKYSDHPQMGDAGADGCPVAEFEAAALPTPGLSISQSLSDDRLSISQILSGAQR